MRNDIVERKRARVLFESGRAAGIDALDAETARADEHRADVLGDRSRRLAVAQHRQQEIVIAENRQDRLVDDRRIGELEMGV